MYRNAREMGIFHEAIHGVGDHSMWVSPVEGKSSACCLLTSDLIVCMVGLSEIEAQPGRPVILELAESIGHAKLKYCISANLIMHRCGASSGQLSTMLPRKHRLSTEKCGHVFSLEACLHFSTVELRIIPNRLFSDVWRISSIRGLIFETLPC
jgi:hypothetical protein